jgi:agmatine/peptidylarginine deiminase
VSTLPRTREGGTPYNPDQSLFPYSIATGGIAEAPTTGLISSPPEYAPTRGVLYQYGNSWNSVVTALVSSLTSSSSFDEIAYVVVANQTTASSAATAFSSAGANLSKVVFIVQPNNSIWIRDYGPHFIFQNGTLGVVDSHYYPTRPQDNFIPTLVADLTLGVPSFDQGLYYSGGNFQPGPNRSGFCTSLITLDNPTSGGHTDSFIRELHQTFQGIDTLHIMPQLPFSVDGTGHIDMWMYLVDQDTVVISEFIPGSNATAISVTNNAVPYMQGLGFEVFRPQAWNVSTTHYTYANAFRVNNRIFIPCYGTALAPGGSASYNTRDADALAKWQAAAGPGVTIVPIQCSSIIGASGAIHCIVMQVPRYTSTTPTANITVPRGGEAWVSGSTQTIKWNATDTNNGALSNVDLAYSANDGGSWTSIASAVPDSGSYSWNVPAVASESVRVRVTARAADGDTVIAISNAIRVGPGTTTVLDFSSGAGVNKFGFGRQTSSWTSVNGIASPVSTALTTANYLALATSNANGSITDTSRYVPASLSSGSESTHIFRFTITDPIADIDQLTVLFEGFADFCTQAELYVWNRSLNNWGDFSGRVGQNRYIDCWAGNSDGDITGFATSNLADYIAADGTINFLVYGERPNDEIAHDYFSVSVTRLNIPPACPADFDGNGIVEGADVAALLASWGGAGGDLDGNGTTDGADVAVLLSAWGTCP